MVVMSDFWSGRRVLVTGGSGFLGRVRGRGACRSPGPTWWRRASAEFDLTDPGQADAAVAGARADLVIHLAARVGGIGYNQAEPAPLYLANLADGHVRDRGRPPPRRRQDRAGRHGVLVPEVHAGAVRRGRACGTATRRRPTRRTASPRRPTSIHAQVNAAQYGQRFAYLIPTNLYGPGDKFHPQRLARHPRADQEVRRCGRRPDATRSRCGARAGPAASTSTSTTRPRRSSLAAEHARGHRADQPRHRPRGHDPRDGRDRSPRLVGFDGELRLGSDQARRPAPPPRRRLPGRAAARLASADALRRRACGATIDWYLAHRDEANRAPS